MELANINIDDVIDIFWVVLFDFINEFRWI